MREKHRLVYPSIAIASFSTLLFELTQTRILSFIFWNYIVYLTVALALLGVGISGTLVSIWGKSNGHLHPRRMSWLWMGFGLSMALAVAVCGCVLPLLTNASEAAKLSLCYLIVVVPFVFSGAILTITFAQAAHRVGRLYAVDLLFAGLACFLFFWMLPAIGAVKLVCLLAATALGCSYLWSEQSQTKTRVVALGGVIALAICFVGLIVRPGCVDFRSQPYKEMAWMMSDEQPGKIENTTWTALARIDVVGNDRTHLLDYHQHPQGSYKIITQDGSAHTRLLSEQALDQLRQEVATGAEDELFNVVYRIREAPEVAIIGVGGGIDVAYALAFGARSITGIELNPAIFQYARDVYADYTGGLLSHPKVTLLNQEGRAAIRSLDRQYDVIQINAIDTFAALSSGAYVLSESHLYTVEAFEDLFARLKDDGVLSIHRWLFVPPRETLRLTVLACEAMKRQGTADSSARIMVIGRGTWAIALFKKTPFSPAEVETLRKHAASIGAEVCYWPKIFEPQHQSVLEADYYATASEETREAQKGFNACIGAYQAGTESEFFATYQYNVTPTTADSPFFFEYNFRNALGLVKRHGVVRDSLRVDASSSLFLILVQSTGFILVAILLPLLRFHRQGMQFRGAASWSVYFAAIGLGFMIIEISVIQKCVLFLGNPMYSLSVVLASLLVSAGIGSALFSQTGWSIRQTVGLAGLPLIGLLLVGMFGLTPLFTVLLHLPLAARMLVVVGVTLPMGLLMGMMFPAGLQAVREIAPGFVPWAWGINGCASVYGSIVAILIAIVYGFNAALAVGIGAYAFGFLAICLGALQLSTAKSDRLDRHRRGLLGRLKKSFWLAPAGNRT